MCVYVGVHTYMYAYMVYWKKTEWLGAVNSSKNKHIELH